MGVLRLGEVKDHTSGGSPLYNKVKLNFMSAFFFDTAGANENCFAALSRSRKRLPSLGKKEMPKKTFRLCGGDQRSARWIGGRFLEKAT